ncbi:MAG: hypothetical protein H0W08_12415 [Acidobacteria bacterium]|nr:hypothetical protein [Acidobacteriota bacterium]
MSITPSSSGEIRALIASLSSSDEVRRESAVARLAIMGPRAVDRLVKSYGEADRDTRLTILRVAETIGDARSLPMSLSALGEGGDLAVAAATTLRALLDAPVESVATRALDALIATALDSSTERRVRMAAFEALQDMPVGIRDRVGEALRSDADPGIQASAAETPRDAAAADAVWQDAIGGRLPEDPATLREAVRLRAPAAPLITLQKLVDAVRSRQGESTTRTRIDAWRQVRGALHQALALRGSRVAVYDLRETFADATDPLPAAFLAAAHVVGDETCLEPIAAAWTAGGGANDQSRWRHQLGAAYDAIVKREKISPRSAALKRVTTRFPEAAEALNTTSRTRPRPKTRGRT